ncbi:hypothetical protein FRB97_009426, partial [Tulasnella sp. 331]
MNAKQRTTSTLRSPRTLILCFDGTGNSFDDDNTNIVRLFSALDKRRPDKQLCYYQPGIGTYLTSASSWSPWRQAIAKKMDEGFAWYLDSHIMGGYRFLMYNWDEGDRICLFGFSRGAYTARCLAGMLTKVGLLPRGNEEQVSFAYKKYTDLTKSQDVRASGFKAAFSREVEIEFVGVWDTVASVGVLSKHLPFAASNHHIKTFRHAMALDEHRVKFKPNPWHRDAPNAAAMAKDPEAGSGMAGKPVRPSLLQNIEHAVEDSFQKTARAIHHHHRVMSASEDEWGVDVDPESGKKMTDVREVWFAGCHADVGGGSVENNAKNSLANPSLTWMINEIISHDLGIYFKSDAFEDIQAFDMLVKTKQDPTPRLHHKGIPSVFLNATNKILANNESTSKDTAGHSQDPSDAPTMVDHGISPQTADTVVGPSTGSDTAFEEFISISPTTDRDISKPYPPYSLAVDAEGVSLVKVVENSPEVDANAKMSDHLKRGALWWVL